MQPGADRELARSILVHAFDQALRLLHPVMPFITEELWHRLPGYQAGSLLAVASWPSKPERTSTNQPFAVLQEAIQAVRQLRADYAIPPAQILTAYITGPTALAEFVRGDRALFARMARCEIVDGDAPGGAAAHAVLPSGLQLILPLAGIVDLAKESAKLAAELGALDKQLSTLRGLLSNEKFTSKARPEIVEAERAKEREWSVRAEQLRAKVKELAQ